MLPQECFHTRTQRTTRHDQQHAKCSKHSKPPCSASKTMCNSQEHSCGSTGFCRMASEDPVISRSLKTPEKQTPSPGPGKGFCLKTQPRGPGEVVPGDRGQPAGTIFPPPGTGTSVLPSKHAPQTLQTSILGFGGLGFLAWLSGFWVWGFRVFCCLSSGCLLPLRTPGLV